MKHRLLFIFLVLLFIAFWILWPSNRVQQTQPANHQKRNTESSSSSGPSVPVKHDKLSDIIATNDVSINFYGIVTDSDAKPLENVEVEWDLVKSGSFAPSLGFPAGARGVVKTDVEGRFSIVNEKGLTIAIKSLKYTGYHNIDNAPRSFGYQNAEPHQPDTEKPVRFVMIEDGGKRSQKVDVPLKFDWDGQPKEFSMGAKVFPNKIIFIPTREPLQPGERIHDWKLVIKAQDGQLFKGMNDGISVAPEIGYVDQIVLQRDNDGQRGSAAEALLYLRTNSGSYAQLRIKVHSDRGLENSATGYIDIRWNPDGGRVFE